MLRKKVPKASFTIRLAGRLSPRKQFLLPETPFKEFCLYGFAVGHLRNTGFFGFYFEKMTLINKVGNYQNVEKMLRRLGGNLGRYVSTSVSQEVSPGLSMITWGLGVE